MDADRNLLFGVLALQADLIDAAQFIEACLLWTTRKEESLADLLIERGWIEPEDRSHVDYLLLRKLRKHGGDIHASLAAIPDDVKRSLAALYDGDIQRSLADLPQSEEPWVTLSTAPTADEHYCRLRLHASGGIGRVWLARDNHLGRQVALKELRPERVGQGNSAARFLQEAQITGQLEHPGIIPVYELVRGEGGGPAFYTMRFVKGCTLSQAARTFHEERLAGQEDPLGLPTLLNAFATVCNTVAYAHSRGVIHRDLKGQNVVLGDFGEVVVLDWGLAKLIGRPAGAPEDASVIAGEGGADSGYTMQGQALGTPAYMAPEQSEGRLDRIDRRTDVYGLGAILYEILTGAPPFRADSTDEVLRKVREEAPAPPRELWPDVPPALESLCLQALAKQPADRPASATELAQEVQGWQEFERRKAEEALRESEALYHSLVESLPCGVWRKDLDGRFTFANQRFCALSGYSLEQLAGKNDFDIGPKDLAEKYRADDQKVLATGAVFEDIEEQLSVEVKGKRYVHTLKTAVRDAADKITGVQVIAWDVTARKLAEDALRESEALYQSLVENIPCLVVRKDAEGRITFANHRFCDFVCLPLKHVLGRTDFDFFPLELAEKYRKDDRQVMESAGVFELIEEVPTAGRKSYWNVLKTAVRDAVGKVTGVQLIAWDITERKLAEEALQRQTEILQSILNSMSDGVFVTDKDGRWILCNPAASAVCGPWAPEATPEQWKARIGVFMPDTATPCPTEELPLVRALCGETVVEAERFMRNPHVPDGIFLSVNASPLRDESGALRGAVSVFRNVTQRKLAEEELRKSQERFQLVVQGSQDGLWDWDPTTDEVYYSPRYKAMLGYTDGEFPNRREEWIKRIHPDDQDRVCAELRAEDEGRESLSWTVFRMQHKDGSYRWIRSRAFILRDAAGRVRRKAGSFEDITERKNAEEELRKSRERFELAVQGSQDGLWDWDVEADQVWYSSRLRSMLGYDEQELPNRPGETEKRVHPDDLGRWKGTLYGHVTGLPDHVELEYRVRHKDGSYRWVRSRGVALRQADGKAYRIAGSLEDITERKLAEQALAYEQYLLRSLMDTLPEGIYFKDRESRIIRANRTVAETVGRTPDQLVGTTDFDSLAPDVARRSFEDEQEIIRTGRPVINKEEKVTWRNGLTLWVSSTRMPLRDPDGNIIGTFGITRSINERKLAEEALRQSEERYRSVIAAMQDGIMILDAAGNIRECNAAAERILGLSAEQIMGRTALDPRWRAVREDGSPVPGDTNPGMITICTGEPCTGNVMGVHKPDGTLTWITVNAQPLFEADGKTLAGVAASFEDITDRKQMEEKLRRTESELARAKAQSRG